jgi:hypothetical protein
MKSNVASNFFGAESTSVNSPGVKSIKMENTMSALSMINQSQPRENSNSRMSKIIEGLARKDSEFQLKTEEETLAYSSKKARKTGDRYIDININTNLR